MRVEYKSFVSKRRFGVEFEVNNTSPQEYIRDIIRPYTSRNIWMSMWQESIGNNHWHIKYDSTCGIKEAVGFDRSPDEHGWEIASFIAENESDLQEIVKVADSMRGGGLKVNERCGLHVHADLEDFSLANVGILVARWIKIERHMVHLVPKHRVNNKHCRLLHRARKSIVNLIKSYSPDMTGLDFWMKTRPTNLNIHDNLQKKVSLNLVNFARSLKSYNTKKTVELRLPEGTLSGEDVKNWVRLFLSFVNNSFEKGMPLNLKSVESIDEFLTYFGLQGDDRFYLLDRNLYDLKLWILRRMLRFGSYKMSKKAREKIDLIT